MRMPKPKYCFDSKCLELAEHFLPVGAPQEMTKELAQVIQDTVEDWCEGEVDAINAAIVAEAVRS